MQSDHALLKRNQMALSAINLKGVLFKDSPATFFTIAQNGFRKETPVKCFGKQCHFVERAMS